MSLRIFSFCFFIAAFSPTLRAEDLLWLDVNGQRAQTALLHTPLPAENGNTITSLSGVTARLSGVDRSEENLSSNSQDYFLSDGAISDGASSIITITLENIPAGDWIISSWHFPGEGISETLTISTRRIDNSSSTVIVGNYNFSSFPASYLIQPNETADYEISFTASSTASLCILNGLKIRSFSEPSFPPVTLYDIDESNTSAIPGGPSPFSTSGETNGNLWRKRPGFGFDFLGNREIYEKDSAGGVGDAVPLTTTITNLTPGTNYGIYSAFLSDTTLGWRVRAGISLDTLVEIRPNTPSGLTYDLGLSNVPSSNRNQYLGFIANAVADVNGEIEVFLDDGEGSGAGSRTWLEGAAAGPPFIPPPPPAIPDGAIEIAPDGVWTWFNDERAIFHQGFLYSGYVREDGHVGITRFDPETGESNHMTLSNTRAREVDDHNNPSISVLPDGRLLAVYSRHGTFSEFYHRTSTTQTPSTDSEWNPQITRLTQSSSTYANTYILSEENKVFNFSRSINFNPALTLSDYNEENFDTPIDFDTPIHFIATGSGGTRPYPRYTSNDRDRIDLIYTDGHPRNENNSIYHLYYKNDAFRQSDGSIEKMLSDIPLDHDLGEKGTVIYEFSDAPYGPGEGPDDYIRNARAWTWDIQYGTDEKPICVFQTQVDQVTGFTWKDDRIYYYYAHWNGTEWIKHFIAHGGRGIYSAERDYGGGMSLDPDDPRIVYISTNAANPFNLSDLENVPLRNTERYEIYRGFTADGGSTFTWDAITENSEADNFRPIVPKQHDREEAVVWFHGRYTTFTNYSTKVLARLGSELETFESFAASNNLSGLPLDDDDGDGAQNLLEFAFGSDPNDSSSLAQTTIDRKIFAVPTLGTKSGLNIMIQSSTDLNNWDTAALIRRDGLPSEVLTGYSMNSSDGSFLIERTDADQANRFYRAQIHQVQLPEQ